MASRISFAATILLACVSPLYAVETPSIAPNSDPTYQQLRNLSLGGGAVSVSNMVLSATLAHFISTPELCAS
jgi:hypothetical protein